jgi:hypothetical protein
MRREGPQSSETRGRIIEAAVHILQKETIAGASIDKVIEAPVAQAA